MYELTDEWLEDINKEFSSNDIPHRQRPWLACSKWSKYAGASFSMDGNIAKRIFSWFEKNTKAGSQMIGPMYTGIFYYDSCFWPIFIPVAYGIVQFNARDSLKTMPETILIRLWKDRQHLLEYIAAWSDCLDYTFGIDDIVKSNSLTGLAQNLLKSGDQQLNATITLLLEQNPNPKAMESARMATEMFLKAFIVIKTGSTEENIKTKIGHDIEKALNECLSIDPKSELQAIVKHIKSFPDIGDRYKGADKPIKDLWRTCAIAQCAGATLARAISGRDARKTIKIN